MAAGLKTILSIVVLVSLSFAGCTGGDAAPAASTDTGSIVAPDEPVEDGGSIEGIVSDDEMAPIGDASVGILELSLEAVTADDGTFLFQSLAPGAYTIVAQKLGYETASAKSVDVVAGETATVTLLLSPIVIEEGYHVTQERAGAMLCGAAFRIPATGVLGTRPAVEPCGAAMGTGTAIDDHEKFIVNFLPTNGKPKDLRTLVGETQWSPSQVLSKGLSVTWENFRSSPGPGLDTCPCLTFGSVAGTSPLNVAIDEENITRVIKGNSPHFKANEPGRYRARTFPYADALGPSSPVDAAIYVSQSFKHYGTEFYHQPAPQGFSVLLAE